MNKLQLKVKSKTHPRAIAHRIVNAFNDNVDVSLSAIGAAAVNNCFKAVYEANRTLSVKGVMLCIIPMMVRRVIDDTDGEGKNWVVCRLTLRNILERDTNFAEDEELEGLADHLADLEDEGQRYQND